MLAAMTKSIALSLVLVFGCVAGATTARLVVPKAQAGTNPTRWEYHCDEAGGIDQSPAPRLNALGAEGWELVSTSYRGEVHELLFCFKRPLG
jgi:hypothetical protein